MPRPYRTCAGRIGGRAAWPLLLALICALPVLAAPMETGDPPAARQAGLIWNRSGLPAVFPLQVKSPAGQDFVLTLIDAETGDAALAAYVAGGAFFRVLVPPGRFRLRFSPGDGAGADALELTRPLTFALRGPGIKAGHLVEIRSAGDKAPVWVTDLFICQSLRTRLVRDPQPHSGQSTGGRARFGPPGGAPFLLGEPAPPGTADPAQPNRSTIYLQTGVRSRYCP
ncbi:hypothetical protein ACFMPD_04420 [Sedimentitalea sp. HM32M-2]|uniref:hypothetical protein n=1 Tax=Sedimentitalea sp. HM32M-2 TaxID=3351566 RepID=UPI00362AE478